jgi:hypothetical protein
MIEDRTIFVFFNVLHYVVPILAIVGIWILCKIDNHKPISADHQAAVGFTLIVIALWMAWMLTQ